MMENKAKTKNKKRGRGKDEIDKYTRDRMRRHNGGRKWEEHKVK